MKRILIFSLYALPIAFLAFCLVTLSGNIPVLDDFDAILGYLNRPDHGSIASLFARHNEHRIVLTRLISEGILAIFGKMDFQVMMLIGNSMLVALALWTCHVCNRMKADFNWLSLAALFMLTSLAHRENTLWAMTSIQNIGVIFFAFASLMLHGCNSAIAFVGSMIAAFIATFTSGGGILVWPCLALAEWFGGRDKRKLAIIFLFILAAIAILMTTKQPPAEIMVAPDLAKPGETVLAKTVIMGIQVEITPMFILRHLARTIYYFIALIGGAAVFEDFTLVLGLFVSAALVIVLKRFVKGENRNEPMLWFLAFLIGNFLPCAALRTARFITYVSSRYCIISFMIFITVIYLINNRRLTKWTSLAMIALSIFCNCYFYPKMSVYHDNLTSNFNHWPSEDAIFYPVETRQKACAILKTSQELKIYNPKSITSGSASTAEAALPVGW